MYFKNNKKNIGVPIMSYVICKYNLYIIDRVHYQIVYSVYEQGSETFDIAWRTQKSPDRGTLNNIKLKALCITVTWQTNQLTFAASLAAIFNYNRFVHSFMSINYRQLFA